MHAFLQAQAPKIAAQVVARRHIVGKAALTDDELAKLDELVAQIDFSGWAVLAGDVADEIAAVVKDGMYEAFGQVNFDATADAEIENVVNDAALSYAQARSAEMVGMRRNAAGDLIENPDARWAITESTRDMIRADVEDAMAQGMTNDELAASLMDSYGFSADRADMIARTETQMAANNGALEGYKASQVVEGKAWATAEDDAVSEDCQENADAGVLALDDDFPSGDPAPPAHPNCRCAIIPVVTFDDATEQE